ncbi:Gp15 family bacteriophage protein [Halalkalibacterium ligniniphilum]|uniref:Gp15 family bacteriophage protein n=1 Tax=Halalkalibacterium ligniniphilum TaxID=1134413 RepID=UPI00034B07B5|nr:Gp15 family bacteriophage protein [Halalkalibacterium ligniniphilum]
MFTLSYPLENQIEIDGVTYQVDMSFDNILRFYELSTDEEIDKVTQIEVGLQMLINVDLDCDIRKKSEILKQIYEKLITSGVKEEPAVDIKGNPVPVEKKEAPYSLVEDAEYVYASFMQDYGIDLFEQQGKLDWRKFLALLDGLRGDTRFKEVVEIRTMELPSGKGSEKQRQKLLKLKEAYKLKNKK